MHDSHNISYVKSLNCVFVVARWLSLQRLRLKVNLCLRNFDYKAQLGKTIKTVVQVVFFVQCGFAVVK